MVIVMMMVGGDILVVVIVMVMVGGDICDFYCWTFCGS